jgi:hypothetical protein
VLSCARSCAGRARRATDPTAPPTRALAAATLAALVAWSLASLFLHLSLVRTLWWCWRWPGCCTR